MKVVVAGCAGDLGSNICRRLLESNAEVIGIDNLSLGEFKNFKELRINKLTQNNKFKFIKLGIENPGLASALSNESRIDFLIDAAAKDYYYKVGKILDYSSFLEVNVLGAARLFEIAVKLKAKKFIGISSYSVYGKTKKLILSEKGVKPKPISPLGASRYAEEKVIEFLHHYYKMPSVVLRMFSIYGPGIGPSKAIYHFMERLYFKKPLETYVDMSQTRDFIYIDDAVDSVIASLNKRIQFQIINVASGKNHTLKEVAILIGKYLGVNESEIQFNRSDRSYSHLVAHKIHADISRGIKILKCKPKFDIEQGIKNTVDWYLKTEQFKSQYY